MGTRVRVLLHRGSAGRRLARNGAAREEHRRQGLYVYVRSSTLHPAPCALNPKPQKRPNTEGKET